MSERVVITPITRVAAERRHTDSDLVAVEAPLEIVLKHAGAGTRTLSLGLVMRTPGDDADLVRGLLVAEQIMTSADEMLDLVFEPGAGQSPAGTPPERSDPPRAVVTLADAIDFDALGVQRVLDRTSACGLCGRLAMQAVARAGADRSPEWPRIDPAVLGSLPSRLRSGQAVFEETGGLHAAALCSLAGDPWLIREDVGRHNAVDKVIGAALAAGRLPAVDSILVVSGRVAFEIVQKAAAAGVVAIAAVGAPSSLAVDAARAAGLTLAGFVRDGRFNLYTGHERVR
jgi:FdhD protein